MNHFWWVMSRRHRIPNHFLSPGKALVEAVEVGRYFLEKDGNFGIRQCVFFVFKGCSKTMKKQDIYSLDILDIQNV